MSTPLSYKKWENIEVSDDEDDTHPNVDTPSLFRWRHKAHVEREEQLRQERIQIDKEGDKLKQQLKKSKISDEEKRKRLEEYKKKEHAIADKERKNPHTVRTLSKDAGNRTLISKTRKTVNYDSLSEEEKQKSYSNFVDNFKDKVKEFGLLKDPVASERLLRSTPELVCDHTASYLVVWCIDLEMEQKTALMEHVAHQAISMQFIIDLAKGINRHPADCFPLFYKRLIEATNFSTKREEKVIEYYNVFLAELNAFKDRVKARAKVKIQEYIEEQEKEERDQRVKASPGGIDPQEVFENLPEEMQKCFESQDIQMLQDLLAKDTEKYFPHIKQCVLSGLWVPAPDSPLYKLLENNDNDDEAGSSDNTTKPDVGSTPPVDSKPSILDEVD